MDSIITVTTPAADQLLVDLLDVKEEFGITDSANDSKYARWIAATSARFSSACMRTFAAETITETYRSECLERVRKLITTRFPIISITSVTEGTTLLDASAYEFDNTGIYRVSSDSRIWWCARKIVAVYVAGYATIPADVSDAVMQILRHKWSTAGRDPMLRSFSIEGVGREDYWVPLQNGNLSSLPLDLQPVADTIAAYRQQAFA